MELQHYYPNGASPRLGRRKITGYHRLRSPATARRPKLKVARLGGGRGRGAASKFIKASQKWWRSNINILSAFHSAYVGMMVKLAGQLRKECRVLGGKKVARRNQIWELPRGRGERIDERVLVEFCNRLHLMMMASSDHQA